MKQHFISRTKDNLWAICLIFLSLILRVSKVFGWRIDRMLEIYQFFFLISDIFPAPFTSISNVPEFWDDRSESAHSLAQKCLTFWLEMTGRPESAHDLFWPRVWNSAFKLKFLLLLFSSSTETSDSRVKYEFDIYEELSKVSTDIHNHGLTITVDEYNWNDKQLSIWVLLHIGTQSRGGEINVFVMYSTRVRHCCITC